MSHASTAIRPLSLLLAALLLAGCEQATAPVEVNVAAINDFHGNLLSNPFSYQDAAVEGGVVKLKAGGIGALSGLVAQLRQQDPELLLIGAGDMIGGSPPISSMWADEPTLEALPGFFGQAPHVPGCSKQDPPAVIDSIYSAW